MLRLALALSFVAFLAWEMTALFGVARALTVDYFDSFEYLVNARILAEHDVHPSEIGYRWRRPPLVSIAQALVYPSGGGIGAAIDAFAAAHMLAWTLSLCALAALFWLLSRAYDATVALLGVVLFAANPMFLHLVPFGLVDVPAMLATTLVLALYLVARNAQSIAPTVLCGLALGAAMSTKYNLLLIAPCLVAFEGLQAAAQRSRSPLRAAFSPRTIGVVAIGGGAWLLLQVALRIYVDDGGVGALVRIFETVIDESDYFGLQLAPDGNQAFPGWDNPWHEYVEELFQVTPLALIAAAVIGAVRAIRAGTAADRLHFVWLSVFLLVMSFGIVTKASRFLLPVLPSLIHLELRGLAWVHRTLVGFLGTRVALGVGTTIGLAAVLWLPLAQALEQVEHFEDPIYRTRFTSRLAQQIHDDVPRGAPILWRGNLYAIYPADPVFFPHDEAFYFYHLERPALEFFLNRPVERWQLGRPYRPEELVEIFPGDGAVVTHEDRFQMTHTADDLPAQPVPIRLDVIERRSFDATSRFPWVLKDRDDADRRIALHATRDGHALPPGLTGDGWHAFYRATADARPEPIVGPLTEPPAVIELLRIHRSEFRYRE